MIDDKDYRRINRNAVKSWIIARTLFLIIAIPIISGTIYGLLLRNFEHVFIVKIGLHLINTFIIVLLLLNAYLHPFIEYQQWRYGIFNDKIELLKGIYIKSRIIIPISRIQTIDIQQGPIHRKYGLASIKIMTAGSSYSIPALTNEEATEITERMKNIIESGVRIG